MNKTYFKKLVAGTLLALGLAYSGASISATSVDFAQSPMLTLKPAPGLVMLSMGRDLPLFKAAYNDVNDIDGDLIPDLFFKPTFKYEGYYAHDRCYTYSTANGFFTPTDMATSTTVGGKTYLRCTAMWSGNFMNWVAMARIDVLRKVLYGGKRSTDATNNTVLERTYVPQDSTLWGKEYRSVLNDGYNIAEFTPLALPTGTTRHMFANVTLGATVKHAATVNAPVVIVYQNRPGRIWDLVATERLILGTNPGVSPAASTVEGTAITQYQVRVKACVKINNSYEDWCKGYPAANPTSFKPAGLLHKYGESKTLAFGLISGTYDNNYAGGVLRQNIDDFNQEVDPLNGNFTSLKGIVYHLSQFRPWGFGGDSWPCGAFDKLQGNGACMSWGNPLGEIMFESLNYFAGGSPTAAFTDRVGNITLSQNSPEPASKLDLKMPAWVNPYMASSARKNTNAYPVCARPVQMTIGDPKTSFDSDHLPGSSFSIDNGMGTNTVPTLGTLNVSQQADLIWNSEFGANSKNFFIGESPGIADGNPSAKQVSSFKNIRGHAPDATTNQGSFYGASVARFGKVAGLINPALLAGNRLRVDQISVALDSHIPKIQIPMNGSSISLVLLSKSIQNGGITPAFGGYQQTGAITAFFIDKMANTEPANSDPTINQGRPYYKFRVSFSDTDQGNDNESDAKVTYEIQVLSANTISVGMDFFAKSTFIEMHQGYVISGTTADGVYLDVGGIPTTKGYYLDTMPGKLPGSAITTAVNGVLPTGPKYLDIASRLPQSTLSAPRTFTVGLAANAASFVPNDMLWYAAKYGGASVAADGTLTYKLKSNGDPENYYLANNPSALGAQMAQAFQKAASLAVVTASAIAPTGAKVTGGNLVYQAGFDSAKWGGELRAFTVLADGNISNTPLWLATDKQPVPASRTMLLGRGGSASTPLTTASFGGLTAAEKTAFGGSIESYNYLLGNRTKEQPLGSFRSRNSAIGDVVNSDPLYIGKVDFGYSDNNYTTFKAASNPNLVAFGSNDGVYRLIDGATGVEKLAFFPQETSKELYKLSAVDYTHQYYVDGPSSFGHVRASGSSPWNSVLASSAGAGGKTLFALNTSVTDFANNAYLWEINSSHATLGSLIGNITNKPLVGQLTNNTGAVLVGNGPNSTYDKASLFVINAMTGTVIRSCKPTDSANANGNGMTSVATLSLNNDGKIDYVYAADYLGNIWRFDPNQFNCDAGINAHKIFSAKDAAGKAQAITGELTVVKAPAGKTGYMVLFGTGKYATSADITNTDTQSLYGVWDDLSSTASFTRGNLLNYPLSTKNSNNTRDVASLADVNGGKAWYEASATGAPSTLKGWRIDLSCSGCPAGERFVDKAAIAGSETAPVAYFLSYVPSSDPCKVGGGAWVTGIDPLSGAKTKAYATIDQNSTFVEGATPRGLFIVKTETGSGSSAKTAEYLYVVNNDPDAPDAAGFGVKKGGNTAGPDGSGTGSTAIEITPALPPSLTPNLLRRQVWRQLQ